MSVRTDQVNLFVNVNSNKAQNELNDLRKKAGDVKAEMEGLKKGTEAYAAKKKELAEVGAAMDKLKQEIGLTALSQKELVAELNKLKALKGSVVPFSNEFKQLQKQIELVEDRLYDVKNGVTGFSSFLSKIKDEVKQFGVAAAAYLGFEFITDQFSSMLSGSGKLSDQLADVRKNTGLTSQEVDALNGSIKKIDTRTANGQLRDLAIDAGKLGIQGRDAIMDFVEAGDQIKVALGEDLGDNAVQDIGKLVDIFRLKEDFGLRDSMLKVGSSINDVGASSAATEGYIVDFLKRMGGIGPSAKIAIPDLIALAGTLDSLGQTSESSSTAVANTISKMVTDFEGFGKIAGLTGDQLKKIFNEQGGLEALKAVIKGVKDAGGNFDDLVSKLGDVGIEGSKAKGVFAILANNLDMLSNQQKIANDSFDKGISLTDEFNIKNQTFGATLDKLGKEFNSLLTSPAIVGFLQSATERVVNFIQVLKDLPKWLNENRTSIILLTGIVLAYSAAKIKAIAIDALYRGGKLLELAADKVDAIQKTVNIVLTQSYAIAKGLLGNSIERAAALQRLWNIALKANPIGLVITVVFALAAAISFLAKKLSEQTAAEKIRQDVQRRAVDGYAEEEAKIRSLSAVVGNSAVSLDARKKALQDLIAINPQYLTGLTLENIKTQEGINIINSYVKALREKAMAQAATDVQAEKLKEDMRLEQVEYNLEKKIGTGKTSLEDLSDDEKTYVGDSRKSFAFSASVSDLVTGDSAAKEALAAVKLARSKIQNEMDITDGIISQNYQKQVTNISKGASNTVAEGSKTVSRTINTIKTQLQELDKKYEEIDVSQTASLKSNRAERQRLQAELDALEGKTPKQTKAERKEKSKFEQLQEESKKFIADLEQLKKKVARGDLDENAEEIQRVQDKYAQLSAQALKYYSKQVTDKKLFDAQETELEKLKQQEISQLLNKFLDKRTADEYQQSLANSDEYFEELKQQTAKRFGDGLIDKKHYEDGLAEVERRQSANRILIAQDYSGTVKAAAEDVRKFKVAQEKQLTKEAIEENEKRKAYTDAEKLSRAKLGVINSRPGSDERLKQQKNLLEVQFELETQYMDNTSAMYLEKQAELNAQLKDLDKQAVQEKIDRAMEYVGFFEQSLNSLNQIIANSEARQLARDKKKTEKDKTTLKGQYDNKLISQAQYDKKVQALDEEQERKEKAAARRAAEREKAINLFNAITGNAAAIVKTMSSLPFPLNVPLAIAQGIAGGLQVAAIASAPLPELGKGDWVRDGDKHSDESGGIPVMIERDEAVMNANTMTDKNVYTVTGNPAQITSALNKQGGGVDWSGGAIVKQMPQWRQQKPATINANMPRIMGQGGVVRQLAQAAATNNQDSTGEKLDALIAETKALREETANQKTQLHAIVSIKEYREKEKQFENSKKAAGINQ